MTKSWMSSDDLAPMIPEGVTAEQCIAIWADLLDTCDQFLLAGLRREIGPDGDLRAAYRRWYAEQLEEHDSMMLQLMQEFHRRWFAPSERGGGHAR